MADVLLVESSLMLEEKFPAILSAFPNVKVKATYCTKQNIQYKGTHTIYWMLSFNMISCVSLQAFQGKMIQIPSINKFLQPGSKRKPQPDDNYVKTVMEVFKFTRLPFP